MPEEKRDAARKAASPRFAQGRPPERPGTPAVGRVAALLVGQGHGFIRLENGTDVFFHRSDLRDGVSFNRLSVGDVVTFELLEDRVSGPRAQRVTPKTNGR